MADTHHTPDIVKRLRAQSDGCEADWAKNDRQAADEITRLRTVKKALVDAIEDLRLGSFYSDRGNSSQAVEESGPSPSVAQPPQSGEDYDFFPGVKRNPVAAEQARRTHNNVILSRMAGLPAQRGTPETDSDPRRPNQAEPTKLHIPCAFDDHAPATGVYFAPEGCICKTEKVQALCTQHALKAEQNGVDLRMICSLIIEPTNESPLDNLQRLGQEYDASPEIAELVKRLNNRVDRFWHFFDGNIPPEYFTTADATREKQVADALERQAEEIKNLKGDLDKANAEIARLRQVLDEFFHQARAALGDGVKG